MLVLSQRPSRLFMAKQLSTLNRNTDDDSMNAIAALILDPKLTKKAKRLHISETVEQIVSQFGGMDRMAKEFVKVYKKRTTPPSAKVRILCAIAQLVLSNTQINQKNGADEEALSENEIIEELNTLLPKFVAQKPQTEPTPDGGGHAGTAEEPV